MSKPVLFHNPRCSKSRAALALLEERGVEVEVVEYLKSPPSPSEVKELAKKLGADAERMVRTKEAAYGESRLDDTSDLDAVAQAISKAPILLERPILVLGSRAAIGRPPKRILELLA